MMKLFSSSGRQDFNIISVYIQILIHLSTMIHIIQVLTFTLITIAETYRSTYIYLDITVMITMISPHS